MEKLLQIEQFYKPETDSQAQKTNLWYPQCKDGGGGKSQEVNIKNIYIHTHIHTSLKQIIKYDLKNHTENPMQHLTITHMEKKSKKEQIYE